MSYQALLFVFDAKNGQQTGLNASVVLVVAPLVLLMMDQVLSLRQRGVRAVILTTSMDRCRVPDKTLIVTDDNLESVMFCALEAIIGMK